MNPRHWGVDAPLNTEMIQGVNREIAQEHETDALMAEASAKASRAQRRRFQRTEWLKTIGALLGSLLLIAIVLTIIGFFVH